MRVKLAKIWDTLRTSYWFVPSLMAIGALGLALSMLRFDRLERFAWTEKFGWLYSGGPEGARAVLSTIAGSMITVAGVAFSITIVALSLASQQFGPRLLYSFMRDRGNQVVLGTFISTFLYCLLVLRTIYGGENGEAFVPHLATTVGVLLAIVSLAVLIFFIHHVSITIQAPHVVAAVTEDLHHSIRSLFPQTAGENPSEPGEAVEHQVPEDFEARACPVYSEVNGYVQAIDLEGLMELACKHDLLLRMEVRPGHFVLRENLIAQVWPPERVSDEVASKVARAVVIGSQRTSIQDVEFSVDQLVEVAVRALSPGINDPFTAVACIDHLGAALAHLLRRPLPSGDRVDEEGRLRILVQRPLTFSGVADAALNQIRQYGSGSAAVLIRMLETLAALVPCATREEDREVLRHHAIMVHRAGVQNLAEEWDRRDLQARFDEISRLLQVTGD